MVFAASRLRVQYVDLFNDYLLRLEAETKASPENEKLINRNSRLACDLHAHRLLCFRNSGSGGGPPINVASAATLFGSFVYLTTRHTWNKNKREHGKLLVPECEVYETLAVQRRRLVKYTSELMQAELDTVMQTALETATSLTGALQVSADVLDSANQWGKLQGSRSVGRFVIVGSRSGPTNAELDAQPNESLAAPSEVEDTGLQGVEMDIQLGQMTLRSKHLAALESEIANKPHVRELFGEHTMQASLLDRAEHRRRYKLIGLRHEIEYWPEGHGSCPALGEKWERDYDPAELHESERWIPPLFEPIRKAFFNGPMPPAMQFMMVGGPLPESVEVAVLLGLHQNLGGPFKLVYLFRHYRCVQVYECVSHARQFWYTLHFASDSRYSLRHLQPSIGDRIYPSPAWWKRGAGAPYPKGTAAKLVSNIAVDGDCYSSCAIIRDAAHESNLSGGREYFVPSCLLYGMFPEALLDTHRFWQDETPAGATAGRRLRGYPKEGGGDHLIFVDIFLDTSGPCSATGMPQRVARVERRSLAAAEANFRVMQRIAGKIESLALATKPPKRKSSRNALVRTEKARKFTVDDEVEVLASDLLAGLDDKSMVPSRVVCENADGTYDLEHTSEWAWLGVVKNVPAVQIQLRSNLDQNGRGVWIWDGMSDSEEEAWCSEDSNDEDEGGEAEQADKEINQRATLTFEQFWELEAVLSAADWEANDCEEALMKVASAKSGPFYDMQHLAKAVQNVLPKEGAAKKTVRGGKADEQAMLLLDLMYAPRRSRLFSVAKTLSSIENLSHICVWSRTVSPSKNALCSIDLVEVPRLKLSFTAREDHEGVLRLFSMDHADLFISDQHNAFTTKLMAGIPHSLLVSNLKGETQLLVPVLPPVRPAIVTEPFSTEIVLNRSDEEWIQALSQHFYLYPIHVSLSFVMPRGLNSALFLLLLRLLNRDYNSAFRMCDSIATDSKFSPEGLKIFDALKFANDDMHPDAHAVRLKVSLVTMESGATVPWDLTNELASYISKLPHVSATCFICEQEELQLLSSESVVMDDQSPKYKPEVHDIYSMTLVKNRMHQLRTILAHGGSGEAPCFAPPRAPSSGWPWYQDNTVFGEQYNEAIDVKSVEDWATQINISAQNTLRTSLAPPGGWLTVVMIHVLWSAESMKLMPRYTELVPMYPFVTFLSVRADIRGLDKVVKELGVEQFPSFLLMRNAKLVPGTLITGQDRTLERLMRALSENVTEADRSAFTHYLVKQREEAGGTAEDVEADNVETEVLWTWDVDCCGPSIRVHEQGLAAELCNEDDDKGEPVVWEYQESQYDEYGSRQPAEWKAMPDDLLQELERRFLRGNFFQNENLHIRGSRFSRGMSLDWALRSDGKGLKISTNMVEGISGYWDDDEESFTLRRIGERVYVKGEEKVLTKAQEEIDEKMKIFKEQREAVKRYRRQQQKGKNTEAIRSSVGFGPGTGVHKWILRWEHEPQQGGVGDAVGIASASAEAAGPCEPPLLGGRYDEGSSVGLYATGQFMRCGKVIDTVEIAPILAAVALAKAQNSEKAAQAEENVGGGSGEAKHEGGEAKEAVEEEQKESSVEGGTEEDQEDKGDGGGEEETAEDGEGEEEGHAAEDDEGEEEAAEEGAEGGEEGAIDSKKKRKTKKQKQPSEPKIDTLWTKGSLVTCVFDTDTQGGRLSFEVDGISLNTEVTGVFALLGGEEIFPCICVFPVENDMAEPEKTSGDEEEETTFKVGDRVKALYQNGCWYKATISKAHSDGTFTVDWDDKDTEDRVKNIDQLREEGDEEDEEDEDGDDEEKGDEVAVEELAKASKLDASVVAAMSPEQREQLATDLRRAAEAGKKARVTIISPVPSSDFFAASSLAAPGVASKDDQKVAVDKKTDEDGDGKKQEEEEEDQDQDDDKGKSAAADDALQPIERIRWMWETNTGQWEVYSPEISREIEQARRDGQLECSLRIGDNNVVCKIQGGGDGMSQESNGETQRLRRHCMKEGLEGQWEMMSVVYKPPFSLYGESALKILQKVWRGNETLNGKNCGLSFIFLYALFQGQMRCRVLTSGYSDWWKSDGGYGYGGYDGGKSYSSSSSSSDSHRLGLLLAQLYSDRNSKSVYASVINVLGRNKQLCVRMPEFKDTRKSRQSSVFNGWTDTREPRSAVGDLFNKVVPLLQGLKKSKQGSLVFPPKPPHPELPPPPGACCVPPRKQNTFSPELSDLDCSSRILRSVTAEEVRALASAVKHQFGPSRDSGEPPLEVDDEIHAESLVAAAPGTLFVLFFHATWCTPCCTLGPIVRKLALLTPAARFLRVDIDNCDVLALRLKVKSLPTIKFVRGGLKLANVLGSIEGIDEDFYGKFRTTLISVYTPEERERMERILSGQSEVDAKAENDKLSEKVSHMLQAGDRELKELTSRPLAIIATIVDENSRLGRGLPPIESKLSFDVSKHEAARTAVAQSMLQRMMDDVHAYAKIANELPNPKLTFLSENLLVDFFAAEKEAEAKVSSAVEGLEKLMTQLQELRALDEAAVNFSIALVTQSANFVDVAGGGYIGRRARTEFLLRRTAGQAAELWPEFLFGSLISSKGESDITALNPYIPLERVDVILQIVMLTMLRANRMGHISRCVGATIVLQKLMKRTLEKTSKETLLPMVLQAADDLADILASGRHYGTLQTEGGSTKVSFDPRFLIFEFAWNILLRQKQVEIVNDFVGHVKAGSSKVKQMIMGAGKTTVVAPLLALMLADSKSLVLSVVPKALLEMSRTQMRETFANIIPKRIYTFKFERATQVTAGMRLTLENAARNRGIVVATPTSLKSVMLVYIETLRMLDEAWHTTGRPPSRDTIDSWTSQAKELAGILSLFKDGVMLLDEVDLILHPLKSELNFPLGEKHALDCSDAGERWTLPIHILDAIFYSGFGRASAFEARGVAYDILRRIGSVLAEGYNVKALQRLPHVTLLNPQWYHAQLKPLMAEWIYLWLQKQHLHGISRQETVTYILEGAVARSEATAKVACIDAALVKVESELGIRPPLTPSVRTPSHLASLGAEQRYLFEEESENARVEVSHAIQMQPERRHLLEVEHRELELAKDAAQRLVDLVHELYQLDEQVEAAAQQGGKRIAECQEQIVLLQKRIQELESPRDDSFDNSTIIWASEIFTKTSSGEVSRYGDEAVVLLACGKLEEHGFTVRRCGTYDEAVERAWQLRASGHLRCVIAGGEAAKGCGRNCTKSHDQDGKCIVCGGGWAEHSGHTCPGGQQGSWIVKGRGGTVGPKGIDASKLTTGLIEEVPAGFEPIPPSRIMLFAGGSANLREDKRLSLWKAGISVTEDKAVLLEWADAQPPWVVEDEDEEEPTGQHRERPPPQLKREMSSGLQTLKTLRQQLAEVINIPFTISCYIDSAMDCSDSAIDFFRLHASLPSFD